MRGHAVDGDGPARRTGGRALAVAGWLALTGVATGCVEWLEVPEPTTDAAPDRADVVATAGLPSAPARVDGAGPLVPSTPGLRVPDGYWVRVRLDAADLVMPYAWAGFLTTDDGVVLRLEASGGASSVDGPLPPPSLRAVVPIRLPEPTPVEGLAGLTLGAEALGEAVVGLRTTSKNDWIVFPEHLVIDEVGQGAVKGTLEGVAKRGTRAQSARPVRVAFVALRAP